MQLDAAGQLLEVEKRDMGGDVSCIDVAPIQANRLRQRFLAVGSYDATVRVVSLEPDDCLKVRMSLPLQFSL